MYPDQIVNRAKTLTTLLRLTWACALLICLAWTGSALADDCTPPAAITSITYPSVSCTPNRSVTVSWSAVSGADTYTLERHFEMEGGSTITVYSGPSTTYADLVNWPGPWRYRVQAHNACGSTDWLTGGSILVIGLESPAYITYPSQDGDGSFQVSWQFTEYADGYTLQRATDASFSDATEVFVGETFSDNTYNESGLANGVYYYRVRSDYDIHCGASSDWKTGGAISISDSPPIGEISSITYPANACTTDSRVVVNWSAATGAATYTLQRSSQPGFSPVDTIYQGADTGYTDTVPGDGVYYYRVRAENGSEYSNWREGGAVSVYTMEAPSYIVCPTFDCDGSFQVVWDNVSGAGMVGFTLQRATNASFSDAVVVNGGSDPLSYVYNESGLSSGVYYYRVRTEYDCPGSSAWYAKGPITVNNSPPGQVSGLTYPSSVCDTEGSVEISWTAASNVSGYHIQRSTSLSFSTPDTFGDGAYTPSYTDSVSSAGVYYYRVRGVNELGYSEWRVGPAMSLSIMAVPSDIDYPSEDDDGSFTVTWQPVGGGLLNYTLQRATSPSFSDAVVVGGGNPTATSYAETGLANGVYYYRVRANYDCPGSSDWRAGGAVTVSAPPSSRAIIDITHSSPSDLVVELGTGYPQSPVWNYVVWNHGSGDGQDQLNLEVDLTGVTSHLPPGTSEPWYVRVSDGSHGGQGNIQGFSIIHNGSLYESNSVPVPINDFSICYAYISRQAASSVTGVLKLLLQDPVYDVIGPWVLWLRWGCAGVWYYTDAVIYDNYTFIAAGGSWHGTWTLVGNRFTAVASDGSRFTGKVRSDSKYISGTMTDGPSGPGCWYAVKDPSSD